jgi:DNA repair exonuclease SbcCD ATPase subunit
MEVLISIENVVLGVLAVIYIMLCYSHNKRKALPDAALSESLPGLAGGSVSMDSSELLQKQAVMIQHLESQVRALGEELLRQRQATSKLQAQPSVRKSRNDDVDMLLVAKDQELRSLKSERDLLRRDVQKSAEDMEATKQLVERLKKENAETIEQLSVQKKKFRQLTKDFTEQQIQLEVHKETNASAQKVIESLTTADDT